jgi:glycosyltransferase involved in cell wall biosynthesis
VIRLGRRSIPLDLAGMGSEELGGLGDVPYPELHALAARYRLFFNPIRNTSLGLAVCEAMMLGMPVVGPATTELSTVVRNGESGYVDAGPRRLVGAVRLLLRDPPLARELGEGARRRAGEWFPIERFRRGWDRALRRVAGRSLAPAADRAEGGGTPAGRAAVGARR